MKKLRCVVRLQRPGYILSERMKERVKNFAILSHVSHTYRPFVSKIVQLCCALVNLQAPLLTEIAQQVE